MSKAGRKIFLGEDVEPVAMNKDRDLMILIWNQPASFDSRHLYSYSATYTDPFGPQCSVHNCKVTHESSAYDQVKTILFHSADS